MSRILLTLMSCVVLMASANIALAAVDVKSLKKKKQTTLGLYITAKEAFDVMQKEGGKTLFIDVRTRAEVNFLGMPTIADANVPYVVMGDFLVWDKKKNAFKLELNDKFLPSIKKRLEVKKLGKNDKIILLCRSGSRSSKAANLLAKAGYTKVFTVVDGYEGDKAKEGPQKGQRVVNGWKNAKLPWTYKLSLEKMDMNK